MFQVTDYYELLALHRALMEAKFAEDPNDQDIQGSPLIANLANRVVETLIEVEKRRGMSQTDERWMNWRIATKNRREWRVTEEYIRRTSAWQRWTEKEKRTYVKDILSPLIIKDELLSELLEMGDKHWGVAANGESS